MWYSHLNFRIFVQEEKSATEESESTQGGEDPTSSAVVESDEEEESGPLVVYEGKLVGDYYRGERLTEDWTSIQPGLMKWHQSLPRQLMSDQRYPMVVTGDFPSEAYLSEAFMAAVTKEYVRGVHDYAGQQYCDFYVASQRGNAPWFHGFLDMLKVRGNPQSKLQ